MISAQTHLDRIRLTVRLESLRTLRIAVDRAIQSSRTSTVIVPSMRQGFSEAELSAIAAELLALGWTLLQPGTGDLFIMSAPE